MREVDDPKGRCPHCLTWWRLAGGVLIRHWLPGFNVAKECPGSGLAPKEFQ